MFGKGRTNFYILKLAPGADAAQVSKTVDAMFENSPDETKTQTEKDFNLSFVKQIGDIGLIVRWILFAVFFTLLLVVGNTMAQSVRERVPGAGRAEDAGIHRRQRSRVRARGSGCAVSGRRVVGLALATVLGAMVEQATGGQFQLNVNGVIWAIGIGGHRGDEHCGGTAAGPAGAAPEDRRCVGGLVKEQSVMFSQTAPSPASISEAFPERWAPSLVIVIGLAGVVAVFTALLAMATGFEAR